MERRIFGLENEYGVTCTLRGQRGLSPDEVARYLFRRVVSWGRSSNVFLANGARLYLDVGSHPEYATPECVDPRPGHPRQGRRTDPRAAPGIGGAAAPRGGHPGVIYLFKNNTDSAGKLRLPRELPHLAATTSVTTPRCSSVLRVAQIYAGAGKVLQTARGAMYCIAQRGEPLEGVSSATSRHHQHRAARRRRALPPAPRDRGRLEHERVRHFLKVGATSILLRMLEDPSQVLRDLTLENPIRAIREISHDTTCRRKVRLANGRSSPPSTSRANTSTRRMKYAETKDLSIEEKQALQMWEHCVSTIERDPMDLDRECDWVIKHKLIEGYRAKHDLRSPIPGWP